MWNNDGIAMPRMLMTRERFTTLRVAIAVISIPALALAIWLLVYSCTAANTGTDVKATFNIILEFLRMALLGYYNYLIVILHCYGVSQTSRPVLWILTGGTLASILTAMGALVDFMSDFPQHLENLRMCPPLSMTLVCTILVIWYVVRKIVEISPLISLDYQNWQTYNAGASIKISFQELYQNAPQ